MMPTMTIKERTTERPVSLVEGNKIVVWSPERTEANRDLWAYIVDYNDTEILRFRYLLLGGLQERLEGEHGLDARDDPDGNDFMLSTLRTIVESMGGHLEVTAVFAGIRLEADISGDGPLWTDDMDESTNQRLLAEDDD